MALSLLSRKKAKSGDLSFEQVLQFLEEVEKGHLTFAAASSNGTKNGQTSYNASGPQTADKASMSALGSGRGGIIPDRVPQFTSRSNAIRQYEYMANDDAAVDISLRTTKMPILAADFYIEAGDDSPLGLLCQEFVEYNLFSNLVTPWLDVVEDGLRAFDYGVSLAEKVYQTQVWAPKIAGANRKNYTMLKDIAARPTPTLGQFYYDDNGYFLSVDQSAVRADGNVETVNIKSDQTVIFTNNRKGKNLEGKSILRTAYKHWFFKNQLYNIDGIQKERHGMGFPIMELPTGFTANDVAIALELLQNIRTNEDAGAALPPGFKLTFAAMSGQPVDVLKSIDHHNGMIMLNILAAFALAGVSDVSGFGRGSSASSQDIFTKTLKYIGNLFCETYNKQVIPQLVDYNFQVNGVYPKLGIRNIGESKDLQQLASAISNLLAQNGITMDYDTEQWIRKLMDFPLKLGGKQTPENNATATKGNVQQSQGDGGNTGVGNNPPQ